MKVTADTGLIAYGHEVMPWLMRDPVRNNPLLTLLQSRMDSVSAEHERMLLLRVLDESTDGPRLAAVAVWPPPFALMLSSVPDAAVPVLAHYLLDSAPDARRFTGPPDQTRRLAETVAAAEGGRAVLRESFRMFEASRIERPTGVPGHAREAGEADRELLVQWSAAFHREALPREPHPDPAAPVDGRLARGGLLWVWESGGEPVSMAALTVPVAGVARINLVFTPGRRRGHGYASALVAVVSEATLAARLRPVLFTDLANPTSNKIYQVIGYRPLHDVQLWEVG
ncbi:GNAT family N-acetyltransferase [Catellatospora sp. TT07R-123]|uniref:GNAT family N-acetyltransferase n=1 Tax=Catellatospora sp. TT07R-123 TaxID=2733863 RepID=UPI001BB410DF|nr:GNAT family N-acetyltransferase [Catellatospora sp. TT07R-123]